MAASQKPIYALKHITHAGVIYTPGQRIDERMPDYAVAALVEGDEGLVTDNTAAAERAAKGELDRRDDVAEQQKTRSEKGETNNKA